MRTAATHDAGKGDRERQERRARPLGRFRTAQMQNAEWSRGCCGCLGKASVRLRGGGWKLGRVEGKVASEKRADERGNLRLCSRIFA